MKQRLVLVEKCDGEVRIRTPFSYLPPIVGGLLCVIGGGVFVVYWHSWFVVLGVVGVVFGAWLAGSAYNAGVVLNTRSGVLVERGDLRRRKLETGAIAEFFVQPSPHVVPWVCLWAQQSSGAAVPLQQVRLIGVSGGRSHQRLQEVTDVMNEHLRLHSTG